MSTKGITGKFFLSRPGFEAQIGIPGIDDHGMDDPDPLAHAPHHLADTVYLMDILMEETRRMYPLDPQEVLQQGLDYPSEIRREIQKIQDSRDRLLRQIMADQIDALHKMMMREQRDEPRKPQPSAQGDGLPPPMATPAKRITAGVSDFDAQANRRLETLRQKAWLTEADAAHLLSLPPKALGNRRRKGCIPRELYDQNGRNGHVRYRTQPLLAYAERSSAAARGRARS